VARTVSVLAMVTDYSLLLRQRLITPAEGRRAQRGKGLNAAAGPIEGYRTGGSVVEKACVGDVREVVLTGADGASVWQ